MSLPFAFFDDARHGSAVLYQKYQKSCFLSSVKLAQLDDELSCGWQSGWHAVITVDYEYGHALQTLPETTAGYLVLHWFAECIDIPDADAWLQQHMKHEPAGISSPRQSVEHADYCAAIESIQNAIPTDGLWDVDRTDEQQIGATYPELEKIQKEWGTKTEADYSGRDLEVYKIFSRMNKAAQHKMQPIPVCDIPEEWRNLD